MHTTSSQAGASTENTVSQPKSGSEQGAPGGTGNATSAPAETPKPACANPNVEATVTNAVQPDYPESARDLGLGAVSVEIEVTVGPSGNLISATVYKSASNMAIDQAALRAARQSAYSPKLINCAPTTGKLLIPRRLPARYVKGAPPWLRAPHFVGPPNHGARAISVCT